MHSDKFGWDSYESEATVSFGRWVSITTVWQKVVMECLVTIQRRLKMQNDKFGS